MSEHQKTVCMDLDGTLARYDGWVDGYHIGEPNKGGKELALAFHHIGVKVLVYTCRTNRAFPEYDYEKVENNIRQWLEDNGLGFCELYVGAGKPFASVYIDDRAIYFKANEGSSFEIFPKALELLKIDPLEGLT